MPLASYNATYNYQKWMPTYENGTSLFLTWCENVTNSTSNCTNLTNDTKGLNLAEIATCFECFIYVLPKRKNMGRIAMKMTYSPLK